MKEFDPHLNFRSTNINFSDSTYQLFINLSNTPVPDCLQLSQYTKHIVCDYYFFGRYLLYFQMFSNFVM